ncbi:MAG: diguanylate cyclase [Cellvibrionaceae bacterium]
MGKVLIVDDDPDIRELLAFILQRADHGITQATNGEEALELVVNRGYSPDLILMDINMPGMDGYETTRQIRTAFGTHWIPILFITGETDVSCYEKGIEAGGDDYLVKPFNPAVLQAKVKALTRISHSQARMEELISELTLLSQQDSLTRLSNRRNLLQRADQAWQLMVREGGDFAVIMMDVDYFKSYNDAYGHVAGDECLVNVSEVIRECISRESDLAGRYGGEEFIFVLPGTDVVGAVGVAEKLRQAILNSEMKNKGAPDGRLTASFGVATKRCVEDADMLSLINKADEFLYRAKAKGRNCVASSNDDCFKNGMVSGNG